MDYSQQNQPNYAKLRQSSPQIGIQLAHEFSGFEGMEPKQRKAPKGSVVVQNFKGWLRLRWTYAGNRYTLSVGLPEGKVNRVVAERKAKLIERDILTEQFDVTLAKYKLQSQPETSIKIIELFEKFTDYKSKQVDNKTLSKYFGLQGYLRQFFRHKKSSELTEDNAFEFRDWLRGKIQPVTLSERLGLLRAAWQWGIQKEFVDRNPWLNVKIKCPPKQRPRPFTKEESKRILQGFRDDPTYSYYADFAEFLLATGCRIGEAAGLRWGHLPEDCSTVWIGESWGRGERKATKTNRSRQFALSRRIQSLLLNRRDEHSHPDSPVFTTPTGKPIDDHNFRNRAWKPILARVGVEYRMPRNFRHTFTSQAIDQGYSVAEVCEITGHSPQTLMRHYLGSVSGRAQLPELWE